jgi:hypothetical protein
MPTCQEEAGSHSDAQAGRKDPIRVVTTAVFLLLRQQQVIQMLMDTETPWWGMMGPWVVATTALVAALLAPWSRGMPAAAGRGLLAHRVMMGCRAGGGISMLVLLPTDHVHL